ncbi:MAG: peptidoglycan-binding domain-containing protein [Eubacteriales bacterium]
MISIKKLLIIFVSLVVIASFAYQIDTVKAENTDEVEATEEPFLLKKGSEGDDVIMLQLRLRDLGYYNYKITNYFGSFTEQALIDFQKVNGLSRDGVLGDDTYSVVYSNDAKRKPVTAVVKPTPKPQYAGSSKIPKANLRDWFSYVLPRFSRGETVKVYDVKTGISYNMVRVGGSNHADVEPATAEDCAKLLATYGGEWSWERRPVVVRLDGEYIAASTNGYPHGYETVSGNDMTGQVCIHFLNSRTHNANAVCPDHQASVQYAYDATH